MSVEFSFGGEFEHSYEKEAINIFMNNMYSRFGDKEGLHLILANYTIQDRQIDITVLKRDGIFVIELKKCEYPLIAHENKNWITINGEPVGMKGLNPYRQVMEYKNIWIDLLRKNNDKFECLKNFKTEQRIRHVKGILTIHPFLHRDSVNNIPRKSLRGKNINWWFKLCGLDDLDKIIERETYEGINFSNDELRFIATELLSMDNPRVIQTTNTENLAEQIRKGTDGLTGIIEESKSKITQLEQHLREKEEIIAGLRSSNDQLIDTLRQNSDMVEQMKLDKNKRDEEIQEADTEKFRLISEYIVINYYSGRKSKEEEVKINNLIKLSGRFGITRKNAIEIVTKAINQSRKCK